MLVVLLVVVVVLAQVDVDVVHVVVSVAFIILGKIGLKVCGGWVVWKN